MAAKVSAAVSFVAAVVLMHHDARAQQIFKILAVGAAPMAVAASNDGRSVYVSNNGANSISVIDTNRNEVARSITVGANPYGLAVAPNSTRLYVANSGDNTVSVIDTTTNEPTAQPIQMVDGENPAYIAITPDGKKAYVTNVYGIADRFSGNVNVIDLKTNTVQSRIRSASRFALSRIRCPEGIVVLPIGPKGKTSSLAYLNTQCTGTAASRNHDPVFVINTDTDLIVGLVGFSEKPNVGSGIAASRDGKYVWASGADACTAPHASYDHKGCAPNANNPVTIIDTETNSVIRQLFFGGPPFITFSPEGRFVYLATDSDLLLIDAGEAINAGSPQLTPSNFPVKRRIAVAGSTGSVAFTSSGEFAYTPVPSKNAVAVIRLGPQSR